MIGSRVVGASGRTYTIADEVGRGGFGVVYLARDEQDVRYAVKLIAPVTDDARLSFTQELESVRGLSHPNVLPILDYGSCTVGSAPGLFTVTPYCADGDYRRVLASRTSEPVDPTVAVGEAEQILEGLDALHARIVHRDIKPENVLRDGGRLMVADFGLARFVDQATRTLTFKGGGTPLYMAPEVWLLEHTSPATDLYAVGIILFEAVTGTLPFSAPDLQAVRHLHLYQPPPRAKTLRAALPDHLDGIIKKLLAKDPRDRFQSARDVLDALRQSDRTPDPAISDLAARARRHHDAVEATRLEERRAREVTLDDHARLAFKEQELAALIEDVVAELNTQLIETRIEAVPTGRDRSWRFGTRTLRLHFFEPDELYRNPEVPGHMHYLREGHAVHGGYLEIAENRQDREGWNLVLVRPPDSRYGEWHLIETRVSPLTGRATRFEPVATQAQLFADNLACHWMHTMHVYTLKEKLLERADIIKILHALIPE